MIRPCPDRMLLLSLANEALRGFCIAALKFINLNAQLRHGSETPHQALWSLRHVRKAAHGFGCGPDGRAPAGFCRDIAARYRGAVQKSAPTRRASSLRAENPR